MNNDDNSSTPFLDKLGQAIRTRDGVDAELAGILVEHIFTPAPAGDCVEQAMTAIKELASARITPVEENTDG